MLVKKLKKYAPNRANLAQKCKISLCTPAFVTNFTSPVGGGEGVILDPPVLLPSFKISIIIIYYLHHPKEIVWGDKKGGKNTKNYGCLLPSVGEGESGVGYGVG